MRLCIIFIYWMGVIMHGMTLQDMRPDLPSEVIVIRALGWPAGAARAAAAMEAERQ